ncbi:MAG: hypothetical protein IT457_05075 [Planctomycetes bacterium]|nr:hypothetical protein [Planctomycetota bacterium]
MTAGPGLRVFVANLDAELELADAAYRRSARMVASIRSRLPAVPGLAIVTRADLPRDARFRAGDAWCPTPSACALLRELGLSLPAPSPEILRRVNHRAFAAALGPLLPGAGFCTSLDDCAAVFAQAPARAWLCKRALGFAGRLRKRLVPEGLDDAARTWLAASFDGAGGGLLVEPFVAIEAEFSLHARLDERGRLVSGAPVCFRADADGAFTGAREAREGELGEAEEAALRDALSRCATALHAAGYFGPFGIDAYRWRDESGRLRFQPLGELNARYTMAWWVGMGVRTDHTAS